MAKKKPKHESNSRQAATLARRKKCKTSAAQMTSPIRRHTANSIIQRVSKSTKPQRVVKPTTISSPTTSPPSTRVTRSQTKAEKGSEYPQSNVLKPHNDTTPVQTKGKSIQTPTPPPDASPSTKSDIHLASRKQSTTTSPFFTLHVPLRTLEDVDSELSDISEQTDLDEDSLEATETANEDSSEKPRESIKREPCPADEAKSVVRFTNTVDIQPYSMDEEPSEIRSMMGFARETSDKLSWLRNQNMYDMNIRLQVRGSGLHVPVLLEIKDAKNLDALWKEVLLEQDVVSPDQIQFKLDESSRPSGYDTNEDEKRFRFGKRAEEQYPAFIIRCQEAARAQALVKEAEQEDEEISETTSEGTSVVASKKTIGLVKLMWRGQHE